jgi:hypothetical protein
MTDLKVRPLSFGHVRDDLYMLPSPDWFAEIYPGALRRFQFHVGQFDPVPEANDCDDYTMLAVSFAQLCHYKGAGRKSRTSVAVGMFSYEDSILGPHVIPFGVSRHAAAYRLLFMDIWTFRPKQLSRTELESCDHYYL